ncbi:hypothetical protein LXL04_024248 [Taraxacum kok-saghyz]
MLALEPSPLQAPKVGVWLLLLEDGGLIVWEDGDLCEDRGIRWRPQTRSGKLFRLRRQISSDREGSSCSDGKFLRSFIIVDRRNSEGSPDLSCLTTHGRSIGGDWRWCTDGGLNSGNNLRKSFFPIYPAVGAQPVVRRWSGGGCRWCIDGGPVVGAQPVVRRWSGGGCRWCTDGGPAVVQRWSGGGCRWCTDGGPVVGAQPVVRRWSGGGPVVGAVKINSSFCINRKMDNRVHGRRSQRLLLNRHGTFANTPDDPFDVPDSDEEDIDDVNDQVIDQIGDQGGGQGIDPGGDQGGNHDEEIGMDLEGDQVVNETGSNRILNVHDNAVPTKQQGEKVPVETSSGIKRWTKSLIAIALDTPIKSHITPIITRDDNASSSKT